MTYKILTEFLPDVEKKLKRIQKKCQRYGNPFTYEVKEEVIEERDLGGVKWFYKFSIIEVEGIAKVDGCEWECVAILEIHECGNVIRRINEVIEIPQRFKTSEDICEHCNSKRHRTNLFIIHNVETNEFKQVGGKCMALYTHGLNAEHVARVMDDVTEIKSYGNPHAGCKTFYEVKEILSYATEIIDKIGYSNAKSYVNGGIPTKWLISPMLKRESITERLIDVNNILKDTDFYFVADDFHKDSTEEKVDAIIEHYLSLNDESEFIHNIQVLLKEGYAEPKNIGFLAYLPEGYRKHIRIENEKVQKEAERQKAVETSQYFGEVKKRYKGYKVKSIETITGWQTDWGYTTIFRIVLADGVKLTWKTTSSPFLDFDERHEVFDKIDFTVKAHTEYKGEKQTEVTRCKITKRKVEVEPVKAIFDDPFELAKVIIDL